MIVDFSVISFKGTSRIIRWCLWRRKSWKLRL